MPHHVVGGSIDQDGNIITACVHNGPSEYETKNPRFIKGDITTGEEGDTLLSFLARIYDNSEGCLVNGGFKLKE